MIYALKRLRGTPTALELLAAPAGDWDAELARFRDLLDRTGTRSPAGP